MNKIITITGPDRVGKQTQAYLLSKALQSHFISMPNYSTLVGSLIRGYLTGSEFNLARTLIKEGKVVETSLNMETWSKDKPAAFSQILQLLGKIEKQEDIKKYLETNHIVADRYDIDGIVYGVAEGLNKNWLIDINKCLIPSDIIIVLVNESFPTDKHYDINEEDTSFSEKVESLYSKRDFIYSINNSKTNLVYVSNNTTLDKIESIYRTHLEICNFIKDYVENIKELSKTDVEIYLEELSSQSQYF